MNESTEQDYVGVSEAARIIGVSRARVYQRIAQPDGGWNPGRPLDAETGPPMARGARDGKQLRVKLVDVLVWRHERETAGQPVGPLPVRPLPVIPAMLEPAITETANPSVSTIGLPAITPF